MRRRLAGTSATARRPLYSVRLGGNSRWASVTLLSPWSNHLREGEECKDREGLDQSKDDGLDVVAWREFPDRKPSKLILFGQCAVGRHWKKKIRDLRPSDWCKRNFAGTIAVDPIPAFFVPMAISDKDADLAGVNQILLDRCRISALCSGTLDDQLDEQLQEWIKASLQTGIALDAD